MRYQTIALAAVLLLPADCSAGSPDPTFPYEVKLTGRQAIVYKSIRNPRVFRDEVVRFEWNGIDVLVNGLPYPIRETKIWDEETLDRRYGMVPRYKELREQGTPANDAMRIVGQEKEDLFERFSSDFLDRLPLEDNLTDEERRAEAWDLDPAIRQEAIRISQRILLESGWVDSVGEPVEQGDLGTSFTVKWTGRQVAEGLHPMVKYDREYSEEKALHLIGHIDFFFQHLDEGVIVLRGGGTTDLVPPDSDEYLR